MFKRIRYIIAVIGIFICFFADAAHASASSVSQQSTDDSVQQVHVGGGYAVSGQIEGVGYTSKLYDATNGLPTSDANYILGSSDGYIWIGGYSGIIRYDGSVFERMDASEGLTSGRVIFEDSKKRLWFGTNDNGVVMLDNGVSTRFTYKEGLQSSSIRSFAQDSVGRVFIGSTDGVAYVDESMTLNVIDDERINDEIIEDMSSDIDGVIYGRTRDGAVLR